MASGNSLSMKSNDTFYLAKSTSYPYLLHKAFWPILVQIGLGGINSWDKRYAEERNGGHRPKFVQVDGIWCISYEGIPSNPTNLWRLKGISFLRNFLIHFLLQHTFNLVKYPIQSSTRHQTAHQTGFQSIYPNMKEPLWIFQWYRQICITPLNGIDYVSNHSSSYNLRLKLEQW